MEDIDLSERVSQLETRVAYLEGELETSYEEEQFQRRVESIFFDEAEIEYRDGHYGFFARVTNINGDEVQAAIDRLENTDYGHAVTETAEGLGMEIWSEPRV